MMHHIRVCSAFWLVLTSLFLQACFADDAPPASAPALLLPKIDRHPGPASFVREPLKSIPRVNPRRPDSYQFDLRHRDVSTFDLKASADDLNWVMFDSMTRWPAAEKMPAGFDPQRILELGKNPGMGIRGLHARGITGRGVGIGIVDQTLLVDHQEFKDRLQLYEEIAVNQFASSEMHGPAVASLAVGRTVGVAPEADLFFIASRFGEVNVLSGEFSYDLSNLGRGVRRLLEVNRQLPPAHRIRAISISVQILPQMAGYDDMIRAMKEADEQGAWVITCFRDPTHGLALYGLGRALLADPDDFVSYVPGRMYDHAYDVSAVLTQGLWVPMDCRTHAGFCGTEEYSFDGPAGLSWTAPYLAAAYVLACQTDPALTPARFLELARKTGRTVQFPANGQKISLGPILDLPRIIDELKRLTSAPGAKEQ